MIAVMTPPASARAAVLARLRTGLSDPESLRLCGSWPTSVGVGTMLVSYSLGQLVFWATP